MNHTNKYTMLGWDAAEATQRMNQPMVGQAGRVLGWVGNFVSLNSTLSQFPSENFEPFISYRCAGVICDVNAVYVY